MATASKNGTDTTSKTLREAIADDIRLELAESAEGKELELRELRQNLGFALNNQELLQEALAELELALEDTGWQRLSGFGDREFSVAGLRKLRRLARLSFLKNPLIRHAVLVQSHYVWGQGVSVSAADEDVNGCIQDFLDDPKNIPIFSGHLARLQLENELQVEGDMYFALFTNQSNGRVVVRRLHPDEVFDIVTNPEDYQEPWYYKRTWTKQNFNVDTGAVSQESKTCYYPDWRLMYVTDPDVPKPKMIGDCEVMWDAPVYHIKVGGFGDQKFGCPEIYSALDWARAVKDDLEDYATIRRAHSRFAFKMATKGGKAGVAAAKNLLQTTMMADGTGQIETNPPPVSGSTWIGAEGWDMNPVKTAGMVPSPEEGRRLWLMVSAGTGIPETILSGNADVGNLATAKTLDRPTELQMENRRTLWTDVLKDIFNYVVDMSIKSPNGKLDGDEVDDDEIGLVSYELADNADRTVDIRFPSILRHEILPLVQAIVWATTLNGQQAAGLIDDRTAAQLLLTALGENEYDDIVATMFPQDTLTVNAGTGAPPAGVTSPPPPRLSRPSQGAQSSTDSGLGDMGGAPPPGQQGISFEPGVSTDLGVTASLRQFRATLEPLLKEMGIYAPRVPEEDRSTTVGLLERKGRGRSGMMKPRWVPTRPKTGTINPPDTEPPSFP